MPADFGLQQGPAGMRMDELIQLLCLMTNGQYGQYVRVMLCDEISARACGQLG